MRPFASSLAPRAAGAFILFTALALAAPSLAQADCTSLQLPATEPVSDVQAGDTATGETVVSGTTVQSFDVTILGTIPDGIAPGIDLILFKASGS